MSLAFVYSPIHTILLDHCYCPLRRSKGPSLLIRSGRSTASSARNSCKELALLEFCLMLPTFLPLVSLASFRRAQWKGPLLRCRSISITRTSRCSIQPTCTLDHRWRAPLCMYRIPALPLPSAHDIGAAPLGNDLVMALTYTTPPLGRLRL